MPLGEGDTQPQTAPLVASVQISVDHMRKKDKKDVMRDDFRQRAIEEVARKMIELSPPRLANQYPAEYILKPYYDAAEVAVDAVLAMDEVELNLSAIRFA